VTDLAQRLRFVGVAAHQRGHVECHRQPAATGAEQHLVARVGLLRVAETGELADRPRLAPVAGGVEPAGERELARPADAFEPRLVDTGRWPVHRIDRQAGERAEIGVAFAGRVVAPLPALEPVDDIVGVHTLGSYGRRA
jgi:hypothetical protein